MALLTGQSTFVPMSDVGEMKLFRLLLTNVENGSRAAQNRWNCATEIQTRDDHLIIYSEIFHVQ